MKKLFLLIPLLSGPLFSQSADRPVSFKLLVPNVLSDQKNMWTFPARLGKQRDWIPAAAVLGTAAVFAGVVDHHEARYFRGTNSFSGFNSTFSSNATIAGTIATPAALYLIGLGRKDLKMQQTALLAGEAVGDAEILTTVLKVATRRERPSGIPARGNFSDNWFEGGNGFSGGSFPSGHTIAAFSVATVVAQRYKQHKWVPYLAYGAAALVGFSRLSLSAHYLSDVFVGAALGYSISRFTVLHE